MIRNDIAITPQLVAEHGLKPDEYQHLLKLIGREPTLTELGIVSAMWNEHCSYKSSRLHLKTLPTKAKWVIQGPGENAGVIDIGDGLACVFKMESHNHPSYIEPYQGATTGVGGILRDVFTMGARPDCLPQCHPLRCARACPHPPSRQRSSSPALAAMAIPSVCRRWAGRWASTPATTATIWSTPWPSVSPGRTRFFMPRPPASANPIVYLGSKTGRDGIHGATMASAEFDDKSGEKRPTVQVGDPFAEKLLLEACLDIMAAGCVDAIQDMGAAGLTCSAVEMGAKGGLGIELDLNKVPCREENMSAYEMMLSESQERMLMVLTPGREKDAEAIFHKYGLDFAIIGKTTDTLRFVIKHNGDVMADLPIMELGDEAPLYDRPWVATPPAAVIDPASVTVPVSNGDALMRLIGSPDLCSKRWVWEQYDHIIGGNTMSGPGGDAAIVRVHDGPKGLAMTSDVTPRYCEADPVQGGRQAVAEAWRNITATGATPLAVTDNLNFGNPSGLRRWASLLAASRALAKLAPRSTSPLSPEMSVYTMKPMAKAFFPHPPSAVSGSLPMWRKQRPLHTRKPAKPLS